VEQPRGQGCEIYRQMSPAEAGWPLIAEKEIDCIFNAVVIAEMVTDIKAPPDAVTRFGDNVRAAVRAYFAERARTNWKAIGEQIGDLYDLVDRAHRGSEPAARRVAHRICLIDQATRNWLERCARRSLSFPSSERILDRRTRKQAIEQLLSILSYGREQVKGRRRPSGKRSRPRFKTWLRLPQSGRGRPRDLAARELVQQLVLTYAAATGRSPPHRVSLRSKGPFFRLVDRCFHLIRIPAGGVVDLINEREIRRKKFERLHRWRSNCYGISES
jgi:hypothetical protein